MKLVKSTLLTPQLYPLPLKLGEFSELVELALLVPQLYPLSLKNGELDEIGEIAAPPYMAEYFPRFSE